MVVALSGILFGTEVMQYKKEQRCIARNGRFNDRVLAAVRLARGQQRDIEEDGWERQGLSVYNGVVGGDGEGRFGGEMIGWMSSGGCLFFAVVKKSKSFGVSRLFWGGLLFGLAASRATLAAPQMCVCLEGSRTCDCSNNARPVGVQLFTNKLHCVYGAL